MSSQWLVLSKLTGWYLLILTDFVSLCYTVIEYSLSFFFFFLLSRICECYHPYYRLHFQQKKHRVYNFLNFSVFILDTFPLLLPLVDCVSVVCQWWRTSLEPLALALVSCWPSPLSTSTLKYLWKNRVKLGALKAYSSSHRALAFDPTFFSTTNPAFILQPWEAPASSALQFFRTFEEPSGVSAEIGYCEVLGQYADSSLHLFSPQTFQNDAKKDIWLCFIHVATWLNMIKASYIHLKASCGSPFPPFWTDKCFGMQAYLIWMVTVICLQCA